MKIDANDFIHNLQNLLELFLNVKIIRNTTEEKTCDKIKCR